MFVTSDIFDLEQITHDRWINGWRERLVGGIAFHGTQYPGAQAAARFLVSAAETCGLQDQLPIAGYKSHWDDLSEHVDQNAIAELARGTLTDALGAECVYAEGSEGSVSTHDRVSYGGGVEAVPRMQAGNTPIADYPYRAFDGDFAFPLDGQSSERAETLLRLAAEILQADYGYAFVRDAFADPQFWLRGVGGPVDKSRLGRADFMEAQLWNEFVREGKLWTLPWPQLRDLFAVNLLSERHLGVFVNPVGYLDEWITAEPGRGRLKAAGDKAVTWSLTDEELHNIRPFFWDDTALTRSCMPRVYRDLPYARERPDPATGRLASDQTSGT
jgi:hypothetical protein